VLAATRRNFDKLSGQIPELEGMISEGDSVAVLVRETGTFKASGDNYNIRAVQWFTFANGKIKKIDQIVASV